MTTAEATPPPLPEPNTAGVLEEITERADTVWTRRNGRRPVRGVSRRELRGPHGRIAIVDGCRTPFVKAGTSFKKMGVVDLAGVAASRQGERSQKRAPLTDENPPSVRVAVELILQGPGNGHGV